MICDGVYRVSFFLSFQWIYYLSHKFENALLKYYETKIVSKFCIKFNGLKNKRIIPLVIQQHCSAFRISEKFLFFTIFLFPNYLLGVRRFVKWLFFCRSTCSRIPEFRTYNLGFLFRKGLMYFAAKVSLVFFYSGKLDDKLLFLKIRIPNESSVPEVTFVKLSLKHNRNIVFSN